MMAFPPVVWGGIMGVIVLLATFVTGYMVLKGKTNLKVHQVLAWILLVIALGHALYGLSFYL